MGVSLRTSQRGLSNGRDWGAKTTAVSARKKRKNNTKTRRTRRRRVGWRKWAVLVSLWGMRPQKKIKKEFEISDAPDDPTPTQ